MPLPKTALPSAGPFTAPKLLLTNEEAAAALNVSLRAFHLLRNEPWMPTPIRLSERAIRWSYAELLEAIAKMPRATATDEPAQLAAARQRGRGQPFDGLVLPCES